MPAVLPNGGAAVMPEFLARRDRDNGPWATQAGRAERGDAWTNVRDRQMRVPTGDDDMSRAVRAHEMMHGKVSPDDWSKVRRFGVTLDTAKAAEEFRVNTLMQVAGFNPDALRDGSEEPSGQRLAENGDWNSIVLAVAGLAGFRACKDLLKGIAKVDPEMAKAAKAVEKAVVKHWHAAVGRQRNVEDWRRRDAARKIGATTPHYAHPDLPQGLVEFTIPIARMLEALMRHPDAEVGDEDESGAPDAGAVNNIVKADAARFAPVVVDPDVELSRRVEGRLGRKRVATNMGRHPRRVGRMLTDPQRRVFDHTVRGLGGLVIIDQSGSMNLSEDDLWQIVNAAPGCMIVGYSHLTRAERDGHADATTPNVWVLADRGRVCGEVRKGNGGNGVDAPAVRWALRHRQRNESVIWVTDGHVRGSRDEYGQHLNEECAALVIRHGIHMVSDVTAAVEALRSVGAGHRLAPTATGYLLRTNVWRDRER